MECYLKDLNLSDEAVGHQHTLTIVMGELGLPLVAGPSLFWLVASDDGFIGRGGGLEVALSELPRDMLKSVGGDGVLLVEQA